MLDKVGDSVAAQVPKVLDAATAATKNQIEANKHQTGQAMVDAGNGLMGKHKNGPSKRQQWLSQFDATNSKVIKEPADFWNRMTITNRCANVGFKLVHYVETFKRVSNIFDIVPNSKPCEFVVHGEGSLIFDAIHVNGQQTSMVIAYKRGRGSAGALRVLFNCNFYECEDDDWRYDGCRTEAVVLGGETVTAKYSNYDHDWTNVIHIEFYSNHPHIVG